MKSAPAVALSILIACGGCSIALDENSGVYAAQPGKYDFLDCRSIQLRVDANATREAELSALMQRANQGAAGAVVSALVYRDELSLVRADQQALRKASDEKRCMPDIKPEPAATGRSIY
ncbi:MAG TPA: hypothetical protein VNR11_21935 [Xanthobacteraceae bacterium]|nr:hypothetical protein [Xanthobacteraceae bacterium]